MGLEPTTSGFTVRRSNQLNYGRHKIFVYVFYTKTVSQVRELGKYRENPPLCKKFFDFSFFFYTMPISYRAKFRISTFHKSFIIKDYMYHILDIISIKNGIMK